MIAKTPNMSQEEGSRLLTAARKADDENDSIVQWVRLNPETGSCRKIIPPEGGLEILPDSGDHYWRCLKDGRLEWGRAKWQGLPYASRSDMFKAAEKGEVAPKK